MIQYSAVHIYMHRKCLQILIVLFLTDVNECTLNIDDCDQFCVNDIGSYHCECHTGYFRDNNSSSCIGTYVRLLLHTGVRTYTVRT